MSNFGFYVSAIDGRRRALVSGPYPSHRAALDDAPRVNRAVCELDPRAHFYGWGTARQSVPDGTALPAGKANAHVPHQLVAGYVIAP